MTPKFGVLSLLAAIGWAFPAFAAPGETVVPSSGHPQLVTKVSGSGFLANEAVDIYFDTTDKILGFTDASGNFPAYDLAVPADALPGTHWITAIGRTNGDGVQKSFVVRTAWPQFGFGASGTRNNPYENVISASNVGSLDLAWSFPTGGIDTASPVVANGIVYIGSSNNVLYALTASTGAMKWSYTTGGPIDSTPAVSGGVVYIGSADKKMYALNATTGALKWTVTTGGDIESSPAVANSVVYCRLDRRIALCLERDDGRNEMDGHGWVDTVVSRGCQRCRVCRFYSKRQCLRGRRQHRRHKLDGTNRRFGLFISNSHQWPRFDWFGRQ